MCALHGVKADFEEDVLHRQWLSQLAELSCKLAGESRCFDWLGLARLCEPKPKAWLGSAQHRTGSGRLGSG